MADKIRPITPDEVEEVKKEFIPDAVFESFNELIAQKWDGKSATIKQSDVVELMVSKGLNKEMIYKSNWLDIEKIYRLVGWKVVYDKPAYTESHPATFTFTRRSKKE